MTPPLARQIKDEAQGMTVDELTIEQFGGVVVVGGFDSLLAAPTPDEVREDRSDLLDIEVAEREAAQESAALRFF